MNNDTIATLNHLITICKDGEQGFLEVAKDIADTETELKNLFNNCADGCRQAVPELQAKVRELGGEAEDSGSIAGSLHRVWVDIKAAITGRDTLGILEECERGEDVAKNAYEQALKAGLPTEIHDLIHRQYEGVKKNHDLVRDLRNRYRAANNS